MATAKQHRILVAFDGSRPAEAALATAMKFPWPRASRLSIVVARYSWVPGGTEQLLGAVASSFEAIAAAARRLLAGRWANSEIVLTDVPPADAILAEAERLEATLIVLGWRGHGRMRRLLAGSVSRSVASSAQCSVLVVRKAPVATRRFLLGFDGSPNSERAIEFLCSLETTRACHVVLVNVVDPIIVPGSTRRFSTFVNAHREVAAINKRRVQEGLATVRAGAKRFERSGWTAQSEVHLGYPLASLMDAVVEHRADVLVLGARGKSGLDRALLGSVANGALNVSSAVLLVR